MKKRLKQSVFLLGEMTWFKSDNFLLVYILKAFVGKIHSQIEYWDRYRVIYKENYIYSFRQSATTTLNQLLVWSSFSYRIILSLCTQFFFFTQWKVFKRNSIILFVSTMVLDWKTAPPLREILKDRHVSYGDLGSGQITSSSDCSAFSPVGWDKGALAGRGVW